jgi:AMMECR1 domain-containing protein
VLTIPQPLRYDTPRDLLRRLRPHVDGVILISGLHRATFLPQVWEHVPDPAQFLSMLCEKARLPEHAWQGGQLEVQTYQVESFQETRG